MIKREEAWKFWTQTTWPTWVWARNRQKIGPREDKMKSSRISDGSLKNWAARSILDGPNKRSALSIIVIHEGERSRGIEAFGSEWPSNPIVYSDVGGAMKITMTLKTFRIGWKDKWEGTNIRQWSWKRQAKNKTLKIGGSSNTNDKERHNFLFLVFPNKECL